MIFKVPFSSLKILCILFLFGNALFAAPPPAPPLDLALSANKLTRQDLSSKKDVADSDHVLRPVRRILQDPLRLQSFSHDLDTRIQQAASLEQIASLTFNLLEIPGRFSAPATTPEKVSVIPDGVRARLPAEMIPMLENLLAACDRAAPMIEKSMPSNREAALAALMLDYLNPLKYAEERDAIGEAGLDSGSLRALMDRQKNLLSDDDETIRIYHEAWQGFDAHTFRRAVLPVLRAIDRLNNLLWDLSPGYADEFELSFDTPHGKVFLGGTGSNHYREEAFLIIDLGGDDLYTNAAGGANSLRGRPISIVIDRRGNDIYRSNLPGAQGAGIFGLGVLVDFEGDDTFEAGSCAQGFGFFGLGILESCMGSRQSFKGRTLVQGAALFGGGILRQVMEGHTRYEALNHAQGFAGTRGFGLLDDQHGNDEYIALGRDEVGWIPGHRFTMAQGFGIGMRPWFGGGIGVLRDLFGNDTYQADVYGQGAGYWYALGILFDSTGRDRYVAKQYAQGAGIHLAAGALIDLEGDDTYVCGAICQGGAHDFSVGLLHDARGNDSYTGSSTAQGAAINNSVAILLDQRGNDSYTGEIFDDSQGSGHDGGRRQYGSIALLLDLSGQDTYSQGWTDGMMWLKPHHGAGLDTQEPFTIHHRLARPRPPRHLPAQIALWGRRDPFFAPARPVDATHPTEILFRRMIRSPLNDAEKAENAEAADELRENALEHLPYLIGRMDSKNIMPRIVVEQMVDQLGDDAIDALVEGLNSPHPDVVRSCLYYLARLEAHEAIPKIVALGADRKLAGNCLYTLGNLRAPEAFDLAMKRSLDARELVRIRAAQALANCPEPAATMRLIHMLKDPFYSVRFAAEDSLVQKGDSILPLLARGALGASNTTLKHIDSIRIRLGDSGHIPTALERYPSPRKLREAVEKKLRESAPPDQLHDE